MADYQRIAQLLLDKNGLPLAAGDPYSPPELVRVPQPPPLSVAPDSYGIQDHVLAALRAMFEGEKYRQKLGSGERDITGLYRPLAQPPLNQQWPPLK